jgi:hypothetical protein
VRYGNGELIRKTVYPRGRTDLHDFGVAERVCRELDRCEETVPMQHAHKPAPCAAGCMVRGMWHVVCCTALCMLHSTLYVVCGRRAWVVRWSYATQPPHAFRRRTHEAMLPAGHCGHSAVVACCGALLAALCAHGRKSGSRIITPERLAAVASSFSSTSACDGIAPKDGLQLSQRIPRKAKVLKAQRRVAADAPKTTNANPHFARCRGREAVVRIHARGCCGTCCCGAACAATGPIQ